MASAASLSLTPLPQHSGSSELFAARFEKRSGIQSKSSLIFLTVQCSRCNICALELKAFASFSAMGRAQVAAVLFLAGLCLLAFEHHRKGGRSELLDKGFASFEMSARRGVRAHMGEAPEEEDERMNNREQHDGEVKIDDPPTGWIGIPSVVGNREVHVQRSRDGGIDRIDVPSDAVVERSADGWTIEIPHERARDADDGYKWLPRGNTLNR